MLGVSLRPGRSQHVNGFSHGIDDPILRDAARGVHSGLFFEVVPQARFSYLDDEQRIGRLWATCSVVSWPDPGDVGLRHALSPWDRERVLNPDAGDLW